MGGIATSEMHLKDELFFSISTNEVRLKERPKFYFKCFQCFGSFVLFELTITKNIIFITNIENFGLTLVHPSGAIHSLIWKRKSSSGASHS